MKTRWMMLAGVVALLAVMAKVPAVAQAVRAALVKNVDERGRNPYQVIVSCGNGAQLSCIATGQAVPAGYELVIENVNASTSVPTGQTSTVALYTSTSGGNELNKYIPLSSGGTSSGRDSYLANTNMTAYVAAGNTPIIIFGSSGSGSMFGTISGYLVNLSQ